MIQFDATVEAAPVPVINASFHAQLVEEFEAAEDASYANRQKAERDHDYYDGKQWAKDEVAKLRRRGQPAISFNLIREKIDYLQGLERSQRTKPRALPRTPMHEEDAQAIGDALKYVTDDTRYDQVRSKVWKDLLLVGWGGTELVTAPLSPRDPRMPQTEIRARRCQWDRMFWDPHSEEDDFSDAAYLGMVLWIYRDEAVRAYGAEAGEVFDETIAVQQVGGTYDDKPRVTSWVESGKRQRVRVVQMYRLDEAGEWEYWEYTKGGILKGGASPWVDEDGVRVHPFDWASAYVDRDNNRYGVVRDMIDPQDEINKRRSKALHHFTSRQTFGTPEAMGGMSVSDMRRELARPDGHVQLPSNAEWGKNFGVIPTNDQAQGHFELLQQAQAVFTGMGPNASMQGKGHADQSGRAVLANQQGGAIQMGTLTDTLRDLDHRLYRRMWNAIRQYWTGETWVRVTDDERNLKWVGLNRPQMRPMMQPVLMPGGQVGAQPVIDPATGQPAMQPVIDPATGQPILQSDVSQVDIDIIIDDAPVVGTMMDEQFQMLINLKQMDQNNEIPFEALIKAAPNLRDKDTIIKGIKERQTPPPEVQQLQQRMKMLEMAMAEAKVQETQASAALKSAQAQAAMQPEQPQQGAPADTGPTMPETIETLASADLKKAQADKVRMDTMLAPRAMQQKFAADRERASQMQDSRRRA